MPYIFAAILTNLGYAIADNANGIVSKKNSPYKAATWVSIFGVVLFFVPLLVFFRGEIGRLTFPNVAMILGLGVVGAFGYLSFMAGMSKGSVMLTGVIGGSFPAVTTFVSLLFFNEHVNILQALAIIVIFMGVILSSLEGSVRSLVRDIRSSAIIYGFGAFFLWGVYYALVRVPVERVGWFLPQYGTLLISILIYTSIARYKGEKDTVSQLPRLTWLLAVIACLQTGASILYNYAISKGPTAVVAPIAGSSPAVFVVLAFFIFKERLNNYQKLGIITAVMGIVGLSFWS